jgi:hypothetical protein
MAAELGFSELTIAGLLGMHLEELCRAIFISTARSY